MSHSTGPSLAVIGAGVAGCVLAARLIDLGWNGPLSLWETGRGPGGRASTRRSRSDAGLRIDHGAPLFNFSDGEAPPPWVQSLIQRGWVEPWEGRIAGLDAHGNLGAPPDDPQLDGTLLRGRCGMDRLCEGLLDQAGDGVQCRFGQLVRSLDAAPGAPWELVAADGRRLARADWLVLSSTLLAHPRARLTLGWDTIPLARAAAGLQDPQLEHALVAIASLRAEARSNLLLLAEGEAARLLRELPFRLLVLDGAARQRWGLERISIQPLEDGRCAAVAHSTGIFAEEHLGVVGSGSAIAIQLGRSRPDAGEDAVITALTSALLQALHPRIPRALLDGCRRQLMRWGSAYPVGPGLPSALSLCPASRIGFCGDFVAGPGFGRVQGAWSSAGSLAERLIAAAGSG